MKKLIKLIGIILTIIGLIVFISFVNHKIKLKNEDALFKTNGKIVEVNGHHLNVYLSGNPNSDFTLVFMSGAGTCSPTLDFKTLYSLFEKDYQIVPTPKS